MCKHYVFVASAGAYKADNIEPMHFEGDERKSSAGALMHAAAKSSSSSSSSSSKRQQQQQQQQQQRWCLHNTAALSGSGTQGTGVESALCGMLQQQRGVDLPQYTDGLQLLHGIQVRWLRRHKTSTNGRGRPLFIAPHHSVLPSPQQLLLRRRRPERACAVF
jgi:hypothetical protein